MLHNRDKFFLDYMQQHNHIPNQYTQYFFDPLRNSLCVDDIGEYDNYDDSVTGKIINIQIKNKINFLKNIGFLFDDICEIKTTEYSWYLNYKGNFNLDNIHILLNDSSLKYLTINSKIIKSDLMIEYINSEKICYNPLSFRQSDDSIKYQLYKILKEEILKKKIYFIGGEMVFISKLLKPTESIMYTDFMSIYQDAKYNILYNDNIHLINYDRDKLKIVSRDYILIANTSKSGMGQNLSREILKLDLEKIVIISCNRKSFIRDLNILQNKYTINKIFDINTNYMVSIYFLIKKS